MPPDKGARWAVSRHARRSVHLRSRRATSRLDAVSHGPDAGHRLPVAVLMVLVVLVAPVVSPGQTDGQGIDAIWKQAEGELGKGERDAALATAKAAVQAASDNPDAWWLLSYVHGQRGEYSQAEAACREGLRLSPEHAGLYNDLGLALIHLERFEDGVEAFRRAVKYSEDGAPLALARSNLGWALLRSGKTDEAIEELNEALRLQPDHALSHQRLAQALWAKGLREEAIAEYRKAARLSPNSPGARSALGQALHRLGSLPEAIEELRAAVALSPQLAEAHYHLGLALRDAGQTEAAIGELRQAVALSPGYAEAHCGLGSALAARGDLDEAVTHYQDAIRLDPGLATAHNGLGQALASQGKLQEALAALQQAIAISTEPSVTAYAQNNLGRVLMQMGKPDEAIAAYQAALDNPAYDTPELALANIAEVLVSLERYDEAVAKYEEALQRKPDNGAIHYQFGNALWAKGDLERAITEFREAIRLDSDPTFTAYAHNNLGLILLGQDKVDEAIDEFRQALESPAYDTPELAETNMADALERKGDLEGATEHRRRVTRLRPRDGLAHCLLGSLLLRVGELEGAEASYRRAIQLASDPWATANAHYGLGLVLQRQGKPREAIDEHRAALASPDFTTPALAHLGIGKTLETQGYLDDAIIEYKEAVRLEPDRAAARNNLGAALKQRGRLPEAVEQLQAAIALDNDPVACAYAQHNLAGAYYLLGRLDEAVAVYRKALASASFDMPQLAHAGIAEALLAGGQVEQAIAEYREAVALAPGTLDLQLGLARAYAYADSWQEARAAMAAAAQAAPDSPEVLYAQAALAMLSGKPSEAEGPLQKALRLPGVAGKARAAVAYYLACKGNAGGARAQLGGLAEALALPQADADIDLLYWTAMAQRKIGDTALSAKTAARLTGRWPKHPLSVALAAG